MFVFRTSVVFTSQRKNVASSAIDVTLVGKSTTVFFISDYPPHFRKLTFHIWNLKPSTWDFMLRAMCQKRHYFPCWNIQKFN